MRIPHSRVCACFCRPITPHSGFQILNYSHFVAATVNWQVFIIDFACLRIHPQPSKFAIHTCALVSPPNYSTTGRNFLLVLRPDSNTFAKCIHIDETNVSTLKCHLYFDKDKIVSRGFVSKQLGSQFFSAAHETTLLVTFLVLRFGNSLV